MEKERRRELKTAAKQQLAAESGRLKAALADAIPVSLDDPDWGRYYKENTLRERRLRSNRLRVLSGKRLGRDLLALPTRLSADGRDWHGGCVLRVLAVVVRENVGAIR